MKQLATTLLLLVFMSTVHAQNEDFKTVINKNGPKLGYSPASGIKLLTIAGKKFKDLNKNGTLDPYEDWRLSAKERAEDLADHQRGRCPPR